MGGRARPLSMADRLHIDQVCVAFEAAWKRGETPASLETCLNDVGEPERSELLRQLLLLDLDYRQRRGQAPGREDYYRLFPADKQTIDEAFDKSGPSLGAASPGTMPSSFGDYEILKEIGRGGMGIVYKAEQVSLKRLVALKMLPFAAVLDPGQLRRFKKEAQAAAQLHHTHIVPVFSIGCERGVHYYAMQYIEGHPLTAVIRELRHLGNLEPIDQGPRTQPVSVVTSGLATGRWAPAEHRETGTPGATPPEPGGATGPDVRSGLGELSSGGSTRGRAFFRSVADLGIQAAEALEHAHLAGIVHRDIKPSNLLLDVRGHLWITDFGLALIQTDATVTMPGDLVGTIRYMSPEQALARRVPLDHRTDIYSLGVTLYELLTLQPAFTGQDRQELLRQITFDDPRPLRKLNPHISRELETIVGKAIAKNPTERYSTAQEMADDLRRFLEDKPIQARPPTVMDRVTKWCRRHRSVVAAAIALLVLAVVGLTASTVLIGREQGKTAAALAQAQIGFETADRERRQAEANYQVAEEQRRRAEEAFGHARDAVDRMLTQAAEKLADVPHMEHVRRALLEDALEFYQEFLEERSDDPEVRSEAGRAYRRVGEINAMLGQEEQAEASYKQAIAIFEKLAAEFSADPDYRKELGKTCGILGKFLWRIGRAAEGEAPCRRALRIWEGLVAEFPDQPDYRCHLGISLNDMAIILGDTARRDEAEQSYRQSLTVLEKLNADFPTEPEYRYELARLYNNIANALTGGEVESNWRQAIVLMEKLVAEFPENAKYKVLLALLFRNLGDMLPGEEGIEAYRKSIEASVRSAAAFPDDPRQRREQMYSYQNLSGRLQGMGRLQEAEAALREAIRISETLVRDFHDNPKDLHLLAIKYNWLASMLVDVGRLDEAEVSLNKAREIQEALVSDFPGKPVYRVTLSEGHNTLGNLLLKAGRPEEAEASYRNALTISQQLVADFPDNPEYRIALADQYLVLAGRLQDQLGRPNEARQAYFQVLSICEAVLVDQPNAPEHAARLCRLFNAYVGNGFKLLRVGQAHEHLDGFRQIAALHPSLPVLVHHVPDSPCLDLGIMLFEAGLTEEAKQVFREDVAILEKRCADAPDEAAGYEKLARLLAACPDPELRDPARAAELAKTAVQLEPEDGWCWSQLGKAYYRLGDWQAAVDVQEKSFELFGRQHAWGMFYLAMAHWQLGDEEQARNWYEQAVADTEKRGLNGELYRLKIEAATLLGIDESLTGEEQTRDQ